MATSLAEVLRHFGPQYLRLHPLSTALARVWRAARLAELLDVPYCHLVFTLPHELNALGAVSVRRIPDSDAMPGLARRYGWPCALLARSARCKPWPPYRIGLAGLADSPHGQAHSHASAWQLHSRHVAVASTGS